MSLRKCKKHVRTGNSLLEVVISENQCRVLNESKCLDARGMPRKIPKCVNIDLAMKELINVFVKRFNLYNERIEKVNEEKVELQMQLLDCAEGEEIDFDIGEIGRTHTSRLSGL